MCGPAKGGGGGGLSPSITKMFLFARFCVSLVTWLFSHPSIKEGEIFSPVALAGPRCRQPRSLWPPQAGPPTPKASSSSSSSSWGWPQWTWWPRRRPRQQPPQRPRPRRWPLSCAAASLACGERGLRWTDAAAWMKLSWVPWLWKRTKFGVAAAISSRRPAAEDDVVQKQLRLLLLLACPMWTRDCALLSPSSSRPRSPSCAACSCSPASVWRPLPAWRSSSSPGGRTVWRTLASGASSPRTASRPPWNGLRRREEEDGDRRDRS